MARFLCCGRPPNPGKQRSEKIEKQLRLDKKKGEKEVKFILLGMPSACDFIMIISIRT